MGSVKLIFTKYLNHFSFEQSHHKPVIISSGCHLKLSLESRCLSCAPLKQSAITLQKNVDPTLVPLTISDFHITWNIDEIWMNYPKLSQHFFFWWVIARWVKGADEAHLPPSGNLRWPPPDIENRYVMGLLRWNLVYTVGLVEMSFTDPPPHSGLKIECVCYKRLWCHATSNKNFKGHCCLLIYLELTSLSEGFFNNPGKRYSLEVTKFVASKLPQSQEVSSKLTIITSILNTGDNYPSLHLCMLGHPQYILWSTSPLTSWREKIDIQVLFFFKCFPPTF